MIVGNLKDLEAKELISPEIKNARMKVLVSPENGWDDYVMRVIEVEKDGYTPKHAHPWPHINYIISGKAELMIDHQIYPITQESYAYVPKDTIHQFRNVGEDTFKFICIVPKEGHK